jgi:hypothetical protein
MFLNDFCHPRQATIQRAGNGDVLILIELENEAVFSMTLTEIGSDRLGMRDHIELRAGRVSVCIADGRRYVAENRSRIVRRGRLNQMKAYRAMYYEISRRIVAGKDGDHLKSLRSSKLCIDLDEQLCGLSNGAHKVSVDANR